MKSLGDRIRDARKELNWSQTELARKAGVSQGAISGLESGRNETSKELPSIAFALGKTVEFLISGKENPNRKSNVQPLHPSSLKLIPVISFVQAGQWKEALELGVLDYVYSAGDNLSGNSFAVKVVGNSMFPEYKEGDLIVIDPNICPRPGDCVIGMNSKNETTFKKYRPRGINENGQEVFELVPLNIDYPTLRSDREQITIIGTVVEHVRKFR